LAHLYWRTTGRRSVFDAEFHRAMCRILSLWRTEQRHAESSPYRFERPDCPSSDTLSHGGRGAPVAFTGMTWSGFRPSDDACRYGYLIPANMLAVVVLGQVAEIAEEVYQDAALAAAATALREEIDRGIRDFGTCAHPEFGTIYAYETDGLGHHHLMDDANVPSLLSIPYLGYTTADDPIYRNTRRFALSPHNPYYAVGRHARGIGSPHTPAGFIWPIALAMQGLTSTDPEERDELLDMLERTDADTGYMHEGFHPDDPTRYTRAWFAWANSLFSEFVLHWCGEGP
jgi:meiotically up-regulated gene 157 (Mug157) protein